MAALSELAEVLDVPVTHLFEAAHERLPENYVVRREARRAVLHPGSTVGNELLVPDLRFPHLLPCDMGGTTARVCFMQSLDDLRGGCRA